MVVFHCDEAYGRIRAKSQKKTHPRHLLAIFFPQFPEILGTTRPRELLLPLQLHIDHPPGHPWEIPNVGERVLNLSFSQKKTTSPPPTLFGGGRRMLPVKSESIVLKNVWVYLFFPKKKGWVKKVGDSCSLFVLYVFTISF